MARGGAQTGKAEVERCSSHQVLGREVMTRSVNAGCTGMRSSLMIWWSDSRDRRSATTRESVSAIFARRALSSEGSSPSRSRSTHRLHVAVSVFIC